MRSSPFAFSAEMDFLSVVCSDCNCARSLTDDQWILADHMYDLESIGSIKLCKHDSWRDEGQVETDHDLFSEAYVRLLDVMPIE
jgi:hypothetical protein